MSAKRSGRKEGCRAGGRPNDRKGSMPFSLVAVLLLVLSSVSIAVLFSIDHSNEDARLPAETVQQMKEAGMAASEDVKRAAYSAALEAIRETRDLDEGSLSQRFREAFGTALNDTYPDESGRFRVAVQHENVTLIFLRASLEDAYVVYGQDEAQDGRVSLPAFFALSGSFVLNVSNQQGRILYGQDVNQDIYLPLPFLFDRLSRLGASAAPVGDLQSMVMYMLTALAQERVLMGYGMGAQTGAWSTEAIVSDEDVVRAVNLALALEQLRIFRSAGDAALAEFPELGDLLDDGQSYDLDPADLFLSSYGDGNLNLAPLVAQSMLAFMDRMLFKYLEYFHIIDAVNFGEDVIEGITWGLRDIADLVTGGDGAQDDIVNYLSEAMEEAGYPKWHYEFNYGSGNAFITLPTIELQFFDDNGKGSYKTFGGKYAIDFPGVNVYASEAWGDFYRHYVSSTHQMVSELRSFVAEVADLVATHCTLRPVDLKLDPADGKGFLDEITSQLTLAFWENPDWLRPAMDRAQNIREVRDDLAQAAMNFLDRQWKEILEMNRSVKYGAERLSEWLIQQLDGTPNFSEESREAARQYIEAMLMHPAWGLEVIRDTFTELAHKVVLDRFEDALGKKNGSGFWREQIVRALAFGVEHLPGVEAIMTANMMKMVGDMRAAAQLWGGEMQVPVGRDGFLLASRNGMERTERMEVEADLLSLSTDGVSGLAVEITRPWDFDRSDSAYPNRHVTDLENMSYSPYLTQWDITYQGSVRVTLSVPSGSFDGAAIADVPVTVDIQLAGKFSVVTSSAWGLKGVDYRSTATLAEDIVKFLAKAWDFLVSGAQAIAGTAFKAFNIFAQIVSMAFTTAAKPLEILSDLLMAGVDAVERLITGALSGLIGAIADVTQSVLGGTTMRVSLFGLTASLVIAPKDMTLAGTDDLIRLDTSLSMLGTVVSTTLRILKFDDGTRSILGNLALSRGDWKVELVMDPLNKIYQHKVEARGFFGDMVIELVLPEVQRDQKVSVKLSDIPGLGALLKLIPSPVPGAKFNIDGGIEVSFNLLSKNTVMINEFEANPAGSDLNNEKVELFNPTDRAVDLSGWSLATSHGKIRTEVLSNIIIPARGYYTYTFSGQALDNGGESGFPLQESIALLNPSGGRVDSAPWTKDLANDGRTWQRSYDGSSTWEFRTGTLGRSNGGVLFRTMDTGSLASMLTGSFQGAFDGMTGAIPDAGTVEELFRSALSSLREAILDAIGDAVKSVKIYLHLGLDDYSGSLGAGIGLALVADGKAVRECFAWAADAVGEMLRDPLNPVAAIYRAPVPVDVLGDHVFIQFRAYISVGLPDMIEAISGDTSVKASVTFRLSLGCFGIGSGGGSISFGLVISDLPGLRIKVGGFSASDSVSVWMLKGTISKA